VERHPGQITPVVPGTQRRIVPYGEEKIQEALV
jgi:hypothetical protein